MLVPCNQKAAAQPYYANLQYQGMTNKFYVCISVMECTGHLVSTIN